MSAQLELMRLVRSASFNDAMAAELLHELSRHAPTADLAYRILDIAGHMHHDAKALEALYQALANGSLRLQPVIHDLDAERASRRLRRRPDS